MMMISDDSEYLWITLKLNVCPLMKWLKISKFSQKSIEGGRVGAMIAITLMRQRKIRKIMYFQRVSWPAHGRGVLNPDCYSRLGLLVTFMLPIVSSALSRSVNSC